ncbi:UDP-N-acetylmuramoyl-L-alanyl-D-glutamate--2,6-diaminopimelate ligase [Saccharopolyspora tripterygii]
MGEAAAAGASALLVKRFADVPVPQVRVPSVRSAVGPVAAAVHGHPADELRIASVTGTNGKTTTVHLVEAALAAAGYRTGLMSTVETRAPGWRSPATLTTPDAAELHRTLCRMRAAGVQVAAMEVSSHAIDQHRIDPVMAEVAVFTNLSSEHLDYHGTVEQYYATKAALFTPDRCRKAVVNIDDPWGQRLAAQSQVPTVTVGHNSKADVRIDVSTSALDGARLTVHEGDQPVELAISIAGGGHVTNLAVAYATARLMDASRDDVVAGLEAAPPPGRFEHVDNGQPFLVVVDFAHTPAALAEVLASARAASTGGRVHLVVGCAGNRDRFNRPDMGRVALAADTVLFTADDPYEEDPEEIIAQMLTGTIGCEGAEVEVEPDRKQAIGAAIRRAETDDVVLIAGRGHERYQTTKGIRHRFSDVDVARSSLMDQGWEERSTQQQAGSSEALGAWR